MHFLWISTFAGPKLRKKYFMRNKITHNSIQGLHLSNEIYYKIFRNFWIRQMESLHRSTLKCFTKCLYCGVLFSLIFLLYCWSRYLFYSMFPFFIITGKQSNVDVRFLYSENFFLLLFVISFWNGSENS